MTIIHRSQGLVYLKSHKTAGTSTEIYLITETGLGGDVYRTSLDIKKYGYPRKRRDREFVIPHGLLSEIRNTEKKTGSSLKDLFSSRRRVKEHMGGDEVRALLGSTAFDSAIVATNIRNPWDAMVSSYNWAISGKARKSRPIVSSFGGFLESMLEPKDSGLSRAQEYLFYPYIRGESWEIDWPLIFEDLAESLAGMLSELGLKHPGFQNRAIFEKRTRNQFDYRQFYSDDEAERVADQFSELLQKFPYKFDRPGCAPELSG